MATQTVEILASDYDKELSTSEVKVVFDEQKQMDTIETNDTGRLAFKVNVPETGKYAMTIEYYPIAGNSTAIERILLIDGKIPFNEARYISLSRIWRDIEADGYNVAERTFKKDINGNEMRPVKQEAPAWTIETLYDTETFYTDPLLFALEEGEHTLEFEAACEPVKLSKITLHPVEEIISYEEYKKLHADKKAPEKAQKIYINAEY